MDRSSEESPTTANPGSRWTLPGWGRLAAKCAIWYVPLGISFNLIEAFDVDMPGWLGHVFIGTWIGWVTLWLATFLLRLIRPARIPIGTA